MGKVTLYHPISLQVLRGALVYGGFEIGKFTQTHARQEIGAAVYTVPILSWNQNLHDHTIVEIHKALNACFASDVNVSNVWVNQAGNWQARIETSTGQTNFLEGVEK